MGGSSYHLRDSGLLRDSRSTSFNAAEGLEPADTIDAVQRIAVYLGLCLRLSLSSLSSLSLSLLSLSLSLSSSLCLAIDTAQRIAVYLSVRVRTCVRACTAHRRPPCECVRVCMLEYQKTRV